MFSDRVDILLATYNGAGYLEAQIKSIQEQTHENWHLLIRDDGSKDDTVNILKSLADLDKRIELVIDQKGNLGVGENFRTLLELATARYIAFCDQDDVWMPEKLFKSLSLMKEMELSKSKDVPLLVHTDAIVVDSNMNVIQSAFIGKRGAKQGLNGILFANSVQGASVLINACLRNCYLEFDASLAHDYHAAMLAELLGERCYIAEPSLYYRQHSHNLVGAGVAQAEQASSSRVGKWRELYEKYQCPSPTFKISIGAFQVSVEGDNKLLIALVSQFEQKITAKAKKSLEEYFYLFDGGCKLKKIWIAIKNQYAFYSRKDILCLLHFVLTHTKFSGF